MGINGPRKVKVVIPLPASLENLDTFKLDENEDIGKLEPPTVMYLTHSTESSGTRAPSGTTVSSLTL
jgi:hypothetical protein